MTQMLEYLTLATDIGMIVGIAGAMMLANGWLSNKRELVRSGAVAVSVCAATYATVLFIVYVFLL